MTEVQRKIQPAIKRLLIDKAGGKCANPGCSNWRVHIHHIKHWAVYKTHDAADMIAVCPACHDAAHHGRLRITDDLLYQWKAVNRTITPKTAHIYVEPAASLKLLTGTISISTTNDRVAVFELSNSNSLEFSILDQDILQISAKILDQQGHELLRVVNNHVRVPKDTRNMFDYRAGRARITVPATENFAPGWLIDQVRVQEPDFAADGHIVAMDIQVLKPGLVQVQGCWPDDNVGVVITDKALMCCVRGNQRPSSMIGAGENCGIICRGPITKKLFGFD
jgi:HNH endonuclease